MDGSRDSDQHIEAALALFFVRRKYRVEAHIFQAGNRAYHPVVASHNDEWRDRSELPDAFLEPKLTVRLSRCLTTNIKALGHFALFDGSGRPMFIHHIDRKVAVSVHHVGVLENRKRPYGEVALRRGCAGRV